MLKGLEVVVRFATPTLAREFEDLHPHARAYVFALAHHCKRNGYAPVVLTGCARDDVKMARFYPPPKRGPHKGLTWRERKLWSWHLSFPWNDKCRAVDLRNKKWTQSQRREILMWSRKHFPDFEFLMHDIGRGDHFHAACPPPGNRYKKLKRYLMRRDSNAS